MSRKRQTLHFELRIQISAPCTRSWVGDPARNAFLNQIDKRLIRIVNFPDAFYCPANQLDFVSSPGKRQTAFVEKTIEIYHPETVDRILDKVADAVQRANHEGRYRINLILRDLKEIPTQQFQVCRVYPKKRSSWNQIPFQDVKPRYTLNPSGTIYKDLPRKLSYAQNLMSKCDGVGSNEASGILLDPLDAADFVRTLSSTDRRQCIRIAERIQSNAHHVWFFENHIQPSDNDEMEEFDEGWNWKQDFIWLLSFLDRVRELGVCSNGGLACHQRFVYWDDLSLESGSHHLLFGSSPLSANATQSIKRKYKGVPADYLRALKIHGSGPYPHGHTLFAEPWIPKREYGNRFSDSPILILGDGLGYHVGYDVRNKLFGKFSPTGVWETWNDPDFFLERVLQL